MGFSTGSWTANAITSKRAARLNEELNPAMIHGHNRRWARSGLALAALLWTACGNDSAPGNRPFDLPGPNQPGPNQPGPNDTPLPADAVYFVAPDGDDATGQGTEAQPWRTVARGVSGLLPGDTLALREGTYFESQIAIARSGTATAPITIRNYPGETAIIDGGFLQFRSVPNQDWEVVDGERDLYRSTAVFAGASQVFGFFGTTDGGYRLVPYEDLGPLGSMTEDYIESAPFYVGPGVFWNSSDQRIYVRLTHGRYQQRLGYAVPADVDPRNTALELFPNKAVLEVTGAANVVVDGLGLHNGDYTVHVDSNSHHLTFRRCHLRGGRYEFVVRGEAHHLTFDAILVDGGFPPWVARSDVKRPLKSPPAHSMQGAAIILEDHVDSVEVGNSVFTALFDAIDATHEPTNLRIHTCLFETIRDDVVQLGTAGHDFEFHDNLVRRAAAAVSWHGSGASPAQFSGTKYIHHNVIDTSEHQLYGRDDPRNLLGAKWRGPNGDGMATGPAFGTHEIAAMTGPDPWKIYHNTIVGAEDVDDSGTGVGYRFAPFDPGTPHEVFNNILVHKGDQPLVRNARADDGSQVFDGNLYFRSHPNPASLLLENYRNGSSNSNFAGLTELLSSSLWSATRDHYAPGWEALGVEGDPGLDADYRPASGGLAANGAVDLSAKGWPGAGQLSYRGAIPAH